jgi:DNA-binding LacI/PurR family transcriptional regulator
MSVSKFQKKSLVSQVAKRLSDEIKNGELVDPLPGEFQLAELLGVSRPTLRQALRILESEGLLKKSKGKKTRICSDKKRSLIRRKRGHVCVIGVAKQHSDAFFSNSLLHQVRVRLAEEGILWEECFDPRLAANDPDKHLRRLVENRPDTCWILLGAPRAVQSFFSSAQIPAIILGSSFSGIKIASVDWDYEAVGCHAAHELLRFGARKIALLVPEMLMAGDEIALRGFEAACKKKDPGVSIKIIKTTYVRHELERACNSLLAAGVRIDSIFVFRSAFAFALLTCALRMGLHFPEDLILLCRDDHPLFNAIFPSVDRYEISETRLVHSALRLIHGMLEGKDIDKNSHYILPDRVKGQTLHL